MDFLDTFAFFSLYPKDLNLLSFMIGMLFGSTMWRHQSARWAAIYFIIIATYYFTKHTYNL
jgi:hypothetical protein